MTRTYNVSFNSRPFVCPRLFKRIAHFYEHTQSNEEFGRPVLKGDGNRSFAIDNIKLELLN